MAKQGFYTCVLSVWIFPATTRWICATLLFIWALYFHNAPCLELRSYQSIGVWVWYTVARRCVYLSLAVFALVLGLFWRDSPLSWTRYRSPVFLSVFSVLSMSDRRRDKSVNSICPLSRNMMFDFTCLYSSVLNCHRDFPCPNFPPLQMAPA